MPEFFRPLTEADKMNFAQRLREMRGEYKQKTTEEDKRFVSSLEEIRSLELNPQETILETYEDEKKILLRGATNKVEYIKLKNDGSGVFKPKEGEAECCRMEVRPGTYFKRERAAYLVDRFLGFDLVPPTVIREFDGEIGSFQEFISDAKFHYDIDPQDRDLIKNELIKLWIFDYIIFNSDRNSSNFLCNTKEQKVYAIDNGLSFGNDTFNRHKTFFDEFVPTETVEAIGNFLTWDEGKKEFESLLKKYLKEEEVESCMKRIEKIYGFIKETGKMPSEALLTY